METRRGELHRGSTSCNLYTLPPCTQHQWVFTSIFQSFFSLFISYLLFCSTEGMSTTKVRFQVDDLSSCVSVRQDEGTGDWLAEEEEQSFKRAEEELGAFFLSVQSQNRKTPSLQHLANQPANQDWRNTLMCAHTHTYSQTHTQLLFQSVSSVLSICFSSKCLNLFLSHYLAAWRETENQESRYIILKCINVYFV